MSRFPTPSGFTKPKFKEKVVFKDFKEEDLDKDHLMGLDISPKLISMLPKVFSQGVTKEAKEIAHLLQHPSKGPTVALEVDTLGPTVA